jgi:hypothetical protein
MKKRNTKELVRELKKSNSCEAKLNISDLELLGIDPEEFEITENNRPDEMILKIWDKTKINELPTIMLKLYFDGDEIAITDGITLFTIFDSNIPLRNIARCWFGKLINEDS